MIPNVCSNERNETFVIPDSWHRACDIIQLGNQKGIQIKSIFPTILKYLISVSERGLGRGLDIEAVRSSGLVDLLKGEYSRARPLLLAKANVIQIQI